MALDARNKRIGRRSWLMAGLALPLFHVRAATPLTVTYDGDNLHPVAPELHFIAGKPWDRLKNGNEVIFVSQLTLLGEDRSIIQQRRDQLVLSYDIWEEKIKVVLLGAGGRSRSGLTPSQAESWCIGNLAISTAGLAPDRFFSLRLELRSADPKDLSSVLGPGGISLKGFIELFSKKASPDDPYWMLQTGRMRLSDLPRTLGQRTRNG